MQPSQVLPAAALASLPRPAVAPESSDIVLAAAEEVEAQPPGGKQQAEPGQRLPPPRPAHPAAVGPSNVPTPPAPPKALPAIPGSLLSTGGPLSVAEVMASVVQHYPLLRAVEQERAITGGRLISSLGVFDLNLNATLDGQGTTYENFRHSVGVTQGLPIAGVGLFAGYRQGVGDFATYNLGQKTADGGEFRAGVSLPLLRDRAIDRPRANVQQARLDVAIAEPLIDRQRLDFQRAAARVYWQWVAAGQRVRVTEALVKLADDRDGQLEKQVREGFTAGIERIDNQQNIAFRNGLLVQVQRAFQQASIDLSLFLRDENGNPTLADVRRLPTFPELEPVNLENFELALRTALETRPEPLRLRLQRDKAAVELELAINHTLPNLNTTVGVSQDVGPGSSRLSGPNGLDRTNLGAGLIFLLPVQRREARGRVLTSQATLTQITQQLRQTEDVVRAEVQDAFTALERAYEFYLQANHRVDLARRVARAERAKFTLGQSDILLVTLREQAAFDADIIAIGAQQDYFRAAWDLRFAVGFSEFGPPNPPGGPAEYKKPEYIGNIGEDLNLDLDNIQPKKPAKK